MGQFRVRAEMVMQGITIGILVDFSSTWRKCWFSLAPESPLVNHDMYLYCD